MSIRLGILGTGAFGSQFIRLFREHPLVRELVLCDHVPALVQEAGRRHGVAKTCTTLDQLLPQVDAVAIFTQHWAHAPQAVTCLEAGKDVYSAVPAAASAAEMEALVQAVTRSGRIYMMGETSVYYSESILVRERYREGRFGTLVYAQAEYFHDWDHGLYEVMERRGGPGWRGKHLVSFPFSYPTHTLGMVLPTTGAHVTHVSGQGVRDCKCEDADIYSGDNPFSNELALLRMSDGSALRIAEMRRIGHTGCERASFYGSEASFERTSDARLWCTKQGVERLDATFDRDHPDQQRRNARLPPALRHDQGGHGGAHPFLVDDFCKAVEWRTQPPVNVWQAARLLLPGLTAHASALRGGELLPVPDHGACPTAVDWEAFEQPLSTAVGATS